MKKRGLDASKHFALPVTLSRYSDSSQIHCKFNVQCASFISGYPLVSAVHASVAGHKTKNYIILNCLMPQMNEHLPQPYHSPI